MSVCWYVLKLSVCVYFSQVRRFEFSANFEANHSQSCSHTRTSTWRPAVSGESRLITCSEEKASAHWGLCGSGEICGFGLDPLISVSRIYFFPSHTKHHLYTVDINRKQWLFHFLCGEVTCTKLNVLYYFFLKTRLLSKSMDSKWNQEILFNCDALNQE